MFVVEKKWRLTDLCVCTTNCCHVFVQKTHPSDFSWTEKANMTDVMLLKYFTSQLLGPKLSWYCWNLLKRLNKSKTSFILIHASEKPFLYIFLYDFFFLKNTQNFCLEFRQTWSQVKQLKEQLVGVKNKVVCRHAELWWNFSSSARIKFRS